MLPISRWTEANELGRWIFFHFSLATASVASLKNLIYFVYLVVEWESNLIIDIVFKVVDFAKVRMFSEEIHFNLRRIFIRFKMWVRVAFIAIRRRSFVVKSLLISSEMKYIVKITTQSRSECKTVNQSNLTLSPVKPQSIENLPWLGCY